MTTITDPQFDAEMLRLSTIVDGKNVYAGHYDEDGNYHLGGGSTLSPDGIYRNAEGEQLYGSVRHRVRLSDGAIVNAIPTPDGANPKPLPPLVPTCHGWPTPPKDAGWPNLDNPTWLD